MDGWCGDAAVTLEIGDVGVKKRQLVAATKRMLDIAIELAGPGIKWSDVAGPMQRSAESEGFGVVRNFVGHGIGTDMHEDPKVPNFVSQNLLKHDILLREGMVLAVEPMVNMVTPEVKMLSDGWTVVTKDGLPSAHVEHTLAITANGVDVLTDGR